MRKTAAAFALTAASLALPAVAHADDASNTDPFASFHPLATIIGKADFSTADGSYYVSNVFDSAAVDGNISDASIGLMSPNGAVRSVDGTLSGDPSGLFSTATFDVQESSAIPDLNGATITVTDYLHLIDVTSVTGTAVTSRPTSTFSACSTSTCRRAS